MVAIELETCRSGRSGGASGSTLCENAPDWRPDSVRGDTGGDLTDSAGRNFENRALQAVML